MTAVREPGSTIRIDDVVLHTKCGHSFVTCHTDRCFKAKEFTRLFGEELQKAEQALRVAGNLLRNENPEGFDKVFMSAWLDDISISVARVKGKLNAGN